MKAEPHSEAEEVVKDIASILHVLWTNDDDGPLHGLLVGGSEKEA